MFSPERLKHHNPTYFIMGGILWLIGIVFNDNSIPVEWLYFVIGYLFMAVGMVEAKLTELKLDLIEFEDDIKERIAKQ